MKMIVGLGNPGKEYEGTRHNMGFEAVDSFLSKLGEAPFWKKGFEGEYCQIKRGGETIIVLKPQTFMNLSGIAVEKVSSFYKIEPPDIYVVYDDMALAPGIIRLREKGSSGGHKGMENIIFNMATSDIARLRVGIGEPPYKNAIDFVLGKPKDEERKLLEEAIDAAGNALVDIVDKGFPYAMNKYNRNAKPGE